MGQVPNQPCAALEKPDLALPLFAGRCHILSQLKNPTGKLEMPGAEAGEQNDAYQIGKLAADTLHY